MMILKQLKFTRGLNMKCIKTQTVLFDMEEKTWIQQPH